MSEVLRDWRPGDETVVEALWARAFGAARGGQTLSWLFRAGPAGRAVRAVAEVDGVVVAHAGVAPLRFMLAGEEVRGGYSVGAMTDPAMQGRGLYLRLGRYLYNRMQELGFAFVAGFSNRNSHRLMTGPLGRTAIRPFPWCVRAVPWFGGREVVSSSSVQLARIEPDDARIDTLWQRNASTVRVGAVRDAAFAQWRYASRPDAGYEIWLCEVAGRPGCWGALRMLDVRGIHFGFLVDHVVDPMLPAAGRALLRALVRRVRAAGGIGLSALLPPSGPTRRALLRASFLRVPELLHPQIIRFSVRGLGRFAGNPDVVDPRAWLLSWADTDVV